MMPDFELDLDRMATGGAALGTGPDGRVVFVSGGLPGERVAVEVVAEHRRRIEARVATVLVGSEQRRQPSCPHVAQGCGGCDWQHLDDRGQMEQRQAIVGDCLRRLAGLDGVRIETGPSLPSLGYRTTVRAAVSNGRAGYREAGSHRVVTVEQCPIAHPLVEEILVEGRFGAATEVTVRVGARTGERLLVADPGAAGVAVPDDVVVVGIDELEAGRRAWFHEEIAGRRLRISARSFFQCRPDGAEALVALVGEALDGVDGPLLDAYCGVGLFGVLLGSGRAVTGVEVSAPAVADAAVNAAAHGIDATVVAAPFERWQPSPAALVVADPARTGLRRRGVEVVAGTAAERVVLVSCDPASLARDAGLLEQQGYRLDGVTTVDLFGQTSHVETVSRFSRR